MSSRGGRLREVFPGGGAGQPQRPGPRDLRKRRAVSRNSAAGPGGPDGLRHDDDCYQGKHGNRLPLAADSSRPAVTAGIRSRFPCQRFEPP